MMTQTERYRLVQGDCLQVMAGMESGSVDAVVTDPPYGMKEDTNRARFSGGQKSHRGKKDGKDYSGHDWKFPIKGDDCRFDPAPWLAFPKVCLWGANHFAARLPVGTTLVWVKRHEEAFGSFLSDAEIAWMKGGHGVFLHKNLSMNGIANSRVHPNQKPVALMKWVMDRMKIPEGATVLDPFMGSGSTGVACLETGRRFIGIELDPGYFAVAEKRLAAVEPCLPLEAVQ